MIKTAQREASAVRQIIERSLAGGAGVRRVMAGTGYRNRCSIQVFVPGVV